MRILFTALLILSTTLQATGFQTFDEQKKGMKATTSEATSPTLVFKLSISSLKSANFPITLTGPDNTNIYFINYSYTSGTETILLPAAPLENAQVGDYIIQINGIDGIIPQFSAEMIVNDEIKGIINFDGFNDFYFGGITFTGS